MGNKSMYLIWIEIGYQLLLICSVTESGDSNIQTNVFLNFGVHIIFVTAQPQRQPQQQNNQHCS